MSEENCRICGLEASGKMLAFHVRSEHGLSSKEYTVKHICGGVQPTCLECGEETRYSAWKFKRYCKEHAKIAESMGGKKGGTAPAWNKGKTKLDDERLLAQSRNTSGERNHFYGKRHDKGTVERISETRKKSCDVSLVGAEIEEFVKSLGFDTVRNTRRVISPKELDIWVPERNVAIEHNGLYWHSRDDKDKDSPLDKLRACRENDIRLLQFFSDEWRDKRPICQSIIRNALGCIERRVYARKCAVVELPSRTARPLLDEWHLDGKTRSSVYFGLVHDDEVVSIMSLRSPFHRRFSGFVEVARFASRLDVVVVGGLGRLVKRSMEWARDQGKDGLMTYADLRVGTGNGYESVGFSLDAHTGRNYWHTDGAERFNRFAFKADKGRGMTEKQVCEEANLTQVYGPGSNRYVIKFDGGPNLLGAS